MLGDGRIVETGTLEALRSSNTYVQALRIASSASSINSDASSETLEGPRTSIDEDDEEALDAAVSAMQEVCEDSSRQGGNMEAYVYYVASAGLLIVLFFLGLVLLWAFCREFPSKFNMPLAILAL